MKGVHFHQSISFNATGLICFSTHCFIHLTAEMELFPDNLAATQSCSFVNCPF